MNWRTALVPIYFHLGGIGGGCLALGSLASLLDGAAASVVAKAALYSAAPLLWICGALLTVHLTRPERFWRVLSRFKWYSPISVGAWALVGASLAATLCLAWLLLFPSASLVGPGRSPAASLLFLGGGGAGWFVVAYTGVLLSASSRPLWSETRWLGAVFCVTGLATAAAWLALLVAWAGEPAVADRAARVGAALALLAAALWWAWMRALEGVPSRKGSLAAELDASGYGAWIVRGVVAGLVVPGFLLALGGKALGPGAILALTVGLVPRAGVFLAGEAPSPH